MKSHSLLFLFPCYFALFGCSTNPPGMYLSVDSFPESAKVVCHTGTGLASFGHTPMTKRLTFTEEGLARGYAIVPCYVQWASGVQVVLDQKKFPASKDKVETYHFYVTRPEGGNVDIDTQYDMQYKQVRAKELAAQQQADATRAQAAAAITSATIMSNAITKPKSTNCTKDTLGNVNCYSY